MYVECRLSANNVAVLIPSRSKKTECNNNTTRVRQKISPNFEAV